MTIIKGFIELLKVASLFFEEGIEGIIDLANLRDESNAKQKKRNQIICKYP